MAHRIAPRIAISALLCLIPALAWGQARWGNLPVFGSVPNLPSPSGLVAGDLDGDGRLDLVAAGRDDSGMPQLVVLLQNASGQYPGVSSHPMGGAGLGLGDGHEALALGDVDADGDLDLVAQGKDGSGVPRLLLFRNNGAGSFAPLWDIRTPGLWDGAVALGDLDGDGDLDLVATGQDGSSGCGAPCVWPGFRMMVFRNDGGGGFTLDQQPFGTDRGLAFGSSLALGDVDSDGDLDVIASGETTEQGRALDLFRNDGSGALTRDPLAIPPPGVGSGLNWGFLRLADLDLDGDLDLVAAGDACCLAGPSPTRQDLLVYTNLGGSYGTPWTVLRLVASSSFGGLSVGDADGNGFPDVFTDAHEAGTNRIRYFANVGGVLVQEQLFSPATVGPLLFADLDGDLDLDMVTAPLSAYQNLLGPGNAAPGAPTALLSSVSASGLVDLTWSAATDAESGPSALAYEVRLGSASGVYDRIRGVFAPSLGTAPLGRLTMAQPGRRLDLPPGTWYWQVRAIDSGLRAGPWSAESSFTLARAMNANDSGPGSLREALALANSDGQPTRIAFHPSLRGQTIALASLLAPFAENDTTIDGDLDGDCVPDIGLSGGGVLDWALFVNSSGSTIRGLAISGFKGAAIRIQGGPGNLVTCNHVGLDVSGSTTPGNQDAGVEIDAGASGSQVGPGNVFAGNARAGGSALRLIDGVESNLFPHFAGHAADYTGRFPVIDFPGNCSAFRSADGIVPTLPGGQVFHSTFGAEFLGTLTVSTSGDYTFRVLHPDDLVQVRVGGALVVDTSCCSTVEAVQHLTAGALPIDVDFLDFNNCHGFALEISGPGTATLTTGGQPGLQGSVHLLRVGTERDRITRNTFRDNGPATSLDLAGNQNGMPQGVTENDPGDLDLGPNTLLNFPELSSVQDLGGGSFRVSGTAPANALVELFASPPNPAAREAHLFVGQTTASGSGDFSLEVSVPAGQEQLTATATDAAGNTSELSAPRTAQAQRFQPDPAVFPGIPIPQPAGLAAGDLDGDGRPDVVMAGGGGDGSCRLLVLRQAQNGTYPGISQEPMGPGQGLCEGHEALALGDVDADGDLDLVAQGKDGSGTPRLLLFRNDGSGQLVQQPDLLTPGLWDGAVALGDLDDDGDLDLLATGQDGTQACGDPCKWTGFRFFVLGNDGRGVFGVVQQPLGIDSGYARGSSLALGDLDSDGDLDVLVSGESTGGTRRIDSYLNWGPQNQAGMLLLGQDAALSGRGIVQGHLRLADTDLDGDLDLVFSGETWDGSQAHQDLLHLRNDGGHFALATMLARQAANEPFQGLAVAAVDEDGWADVVTLVNAPGWRLRWYRGQGGSFALAEDLPSNATGPLLLADLDGDTDLDVVVLPPNDGLWRNAAGAPAPALAAPTNLESWLQPDGRLALGWSAPPGGNGRTPAQALAYEVRVGRFAGAWDVVSGIYPADARGSFPPSRLSSQAPGRPLALPQGSYFWQVRAIDIGLFAGPWSGSAFVAAPRSVGIEDAEAVEGQPLVFRVSLSSPAPQPVTVAYAGQGVTAQPGADFDAISGVLTFAPGETMRTISVPSVQDALDEDDETFAITLSSPGGGVALLDPRALGTIRDDDPLPVVSIESASWPEGNSGSTTAPLTVRLSAASGRAVSVDFSVSDGSATAGSDYTAPGFTRLTFAAGQLTLTLGIDVLGDVAMEGDETVLVALTSAHNAGLGAATGTLTILDDEQVLTPPVDGNWLLAREGMTPVGACGLAAHGSTYVYVGSSGDLWTSLDGGSTWSKRANPDSVAGRNVRGVAWGGPVGAEQFVAVGIADPSGGGSLVLTSPDGLTWTQRSSAPFNRPLNCLAYGAGLWTAVGLGGGQGRVLTSPDAITWTERTSGTSNTLNAVTFASGRFLAVGENRTILTSTSGLTWTQPSVPGDAPQSLRAVAWSGSRFAAVGATVAGSTTTPGIVVSSDGLNWSTRSVPAATVDLRGVATGAGAVVAVGSSNQLVSPELTLGQVIASTDGGLNWTAVTVPALVPGISPGLQRVAYGDAGFLAGGTRGNLLASASGTSGWTQRTLPASRQFLATAYGAGRYCAVGYNAGVAYSADGVSWTDANAVPDPKLYYLWVNLTFANGLFVAVGGPGNAIMTSADCQTWTLRHPAAPPTPNDPLAPFLTSVAWGGGRWVALGETYQPDGSSTPELLTSTDALAWTAGSLGVPPAPPGDTYWLGWHGYPVAWGNGRFVSVVSEMNGQAFPLTSSDGLTWTRQPVLPTVSQEAIDDVAFDGSRFIAVGDRIWTSSDGVAWTPRTDFTSYLLGVAVGNGRRVAVGFGGLTYASADGLTWVQDTNATLHDLYDVSHGGSRFVAAGTSAITTTDFGPLLSVSDVQMPEGNSGSTNANFTVTLSQAAAANVTVSYATVAGTATAGSDYTSRSGALTFTPGQTSKTVAVPVLGDVRDEPDEVFELQLSSPVGATIARHGLGTITDDDATPSLSAGNASAAEGNSGTKNLTFTVSLSAASGRQVTVAWATADASATAPSDYTSASGALTFAAGTVSRTFTVSIKGDTLAEPNEDFRVALSNPVYASLGAAQGTGTITNDDGTPPQLSISDVTLAEGDSGGTTATFTVTLAPAAAQPVSVDFATLDGTAVAPQDYSAISGTLSFPAGVTSLPLAVQVNGDRLSEPDETFQALLTLARNAGLADAQGLATITNDDAAPVPRIDWLAPVSVVPGTPTLSLHVHGANFMPQAVVQVGGSAVPTTYLGPSELRADLGSGPLSSPGTLEVVVAGPGAAGGLSNAALLPVSVPHPTLAFGRVDLPTSPSPQALASGDLDRDGVADLVTTRGGAVAVYRGVGDGSFAFVGTFPLATAPISLLVADVDGDGNPDVVAGTNGPSPALSVLWGAGDGTLPSRLDLGYGSAVAVVAGDLDRDGRLDLAALDRGYSLLDVYRSTGPRSFDTAVSYGTGPQPESLATGDLDGDGVLDVALTCSGDGTLLARHGNGDGSFGPRVLSATGLSAFFLALAEASGDGVLDAAVTSKTATSMVLLVGNGDLTFTPEANPESVRHSQTVLVAADFTADGELDAAYVGRGSPGHVEVLAGAAPIGDTVVGNQPVALVAGDWNGDGRLDVAVANSASNSVSVLRSTDPPVITSFTATPSAGYPPLSVTFNGTAHDPDGAIVSYVWDFDGNGTDDRTTTVFTTAFTYTNTFTARVRVVDDAGASASATTTISTSVSPSLSINDISVNEGNSGTTNAVFTVTLSYGTGPVTVDYFTTSNLYCPAGLAYVGTPGSLDPYGTLTLSPASPTATITVQVIGDTLPEPDCTFNVQLANPAGASFQRNGATGTIVDDDQVVPALTVDDVSVREGFAGQAAQALFSVRLSARTNSPVTVAYATADDTAQAGSDYDAQSGTLSFDAGESLKVVAVTVRSDMVSEPDQRFFLDLSSPVGATLGDSRGIATIVDNPGQAPATTSIAWTLDREGMTGINGLATNGSVYVAVGTSAALWTSPDGVAWTKRSVPISNPNLPLNGVTWGNGQFVAVGGCCADDGGGLVLTSPDGLTWTRRSTLPSARTWNGVTWGGGLFVAAGSSRALTSPDGLTWTDRPTPARSTLRAIAYGNGRFVAVGALRSLVTSTDGVSWSARTLPSTIESRLNAVLWTGSQFVTVAGDPSTRQDSGGSILTSPDGLTWTVRSSPTLQPLNGLAVGAGLIVATSGTDPTPAHNSILTSPDGVTWTPRSFTLPATGGTSGSLGAITFGPAGFLAGGVRGTLFASADGLTWQSRTLPASRLLLGAAWNGSTFCAVGINGAVSRSTNGAQWTDVATGLELERYSGWYAVTYASGQFVMAGVNLGIATSPDCQTWTRRYPASDPPYGQAIGTFYDITWGDGLYVAVGMRTPTATTASPVIFTSPDGLTWTERTSAVPAGNRRRFVTTAWGNGRFVAFAEDLDTLQVLLNTSEDGLTWTLRESPAPDMYLPENANDVVFGEGRFVMVADRIRTSTDGLAWTVRQDWGDDYFRGLAYGSGRFLAIGQPGAIYLSDDGESWTKNTVPTGNVLYGAVVAGRRLVAVGESVALHADLPAPVVSVQSDVSVTEGNSGTTNATFTVGLYDAADTTMTVDYFTSNADAVAGNDYDATIGTLTFAPGVASQQVAVPVRGDTRGEAHEGFWLNLANPWGATIGTRSRLATILNDDAAPCVAVNDAEIPEGNSGSRALLFNVYLSASGYTPTTLSYTTTPGTATPGTDYVTTSGTLTFDPGVRSLVVPVTVSGDTAVEPDETFFLDVSGVAGATVCDARGQATILNDEAAVPPPPLGSLGLVREGPLYYGAASDGLRYVLVGQNGDIWTSTDTLTWSRPVNPDPLKRTLNAVTWGGGKFVAVGQWNAFTGGGDGGPIVLTSPDGLNWTKQATTSLGNRTLYGVTWGGGRYVAVGTAGRALTSPDGINWTAVNTFVANSLLGVAWGNGVYVAAGNNRTIVTSPDASTWTLRSVPTTVAPSLGPVLWSGGQFVVGSRSAAGGILTSPDGIDWTLRSTPAAGGVITLAEGAGRLLAVGNVFGDNGIPPSQPSSLEPTPTLLTSTDSGSSWAAGSLTPGTGASPNLRTVTWGPLGFLAGGVRGNIYVSPDGLSWTDRTPAASRQLDGIAHDGTRFCAVGANGAILSSPDGAAWTPQAGPSPAAYWHWSNLIWTGTQFVAVGVSSAIMTSPDCATWTVRYPAAPLTPGLATSFLSDVVAGGSVLVAVGESYPSSTQTVPLMVASTDGGLTWTPRTPPVPSAGLPGFITVGWGGGLFVAFGKDYASGDLFSVTSPDGLTWTSRASDVFDNGAFEEINDIAYGNGVFVAAADRIWSSRDGIHWTLRKEYGSYFHGVTWTGSRFVAVAAYGGFWTSPEGEVWSELAPVTTHDLYAAAASPAGHLVAVGQAAIVATDAAGFAISDVVVAEGETAGFTVTLSVPSSQAATVAWATASGTALAGSDYTTASGVLTFPAGVTSRTLSVTTLQDSLDETDETFRVVLSAPTGAGLADAEGVGTIADDDPLPALSVNDATRAEGHSGSSNATFTVTLAPASGRTVIVTYATADQTATAGSDYTASSGTLTFAPGATSQTFAVPVLGDLLDEPDETFTVTLATPVDATLADASGVGTITDDDALPGLAIADASRAEGNLGSVPLTFAVTLSAVSGQQVTVGYATGGGTASAGVDYTSASGTLTFAPGTTSRTLDVAVLGDLLDEADETLVVTLAAPTNAALADATGTGTILDDDGPPALAIGDVTVAEAGTATFTLTLAPASGRQVTVAFATADGTAVAPADYAASSGVLTFPPGTTTRTIAVAVAGDALDEDDETFRVDLSGPVDATLADSSGLATITDDDPLPAIAIGDALVTEIDAAGRTATLTLTLTPSSGRPVSVLYTTIPGTASAGSDFTAASGTLTFAAGQTTRTLSVPITGDRLPEPLERFTVELLSVTNGTLADASGQVTIRDDDPEAVDFAGDGTADTVVYRTGAWLFYDYATGTALPGVWTGQPLSSCIPAPADFTGDGSVEFSMLCGDRWLFYGASGALTKTIFTGGTGTDYPVPADYDGDGRDEVALFRAGAWYFYSYQTGLQTGAIWTGEPPPLTGRSIPYPADFDGDGKADLSIFAGGPWHFYNPDGSYRKGIWTGGVSGDLPVAGDYDGDGVDDVVVWRSGAWLFFDYATGQYLAGRSVYTGAPPHATGGVPLPAPTDVDGDGKLEFAVYSGGPWHFFRDDGTYDKGIWCGAVVGDLPISRRPLP